MSEDKSTVLLLSGKVVGAGSSVDEPKNGKSAAAESEEIAAMLQKAALDDEINELGMYSTRLLDQQLHVYRLTELNSRLPFQNRRSPRN